MLEQGHRAAGLLAWLCAMYVSGAFAAGPRSLPIGDLPHDRRLGELQHLDGNFPFRVPATRSEWEQRAAELRRRVSVAAGLWPLPERTPLNAVIHGRVERAGFTVEKVYVESVPGHFVTGLLFRPVGQTGRVPGVLCPHGHGGRLHDHGDAIRQLIADGEERFEDCGRFPKLSLCVQLARMGCVAFSYDMLGYADSVQIPSSVAHGYSKPRPEMEGKQEWGFYSPQAELRLQSVLGLQTWNSVRALDFLCSLPDVDATRIGVTGGSGGGTQTILLAAIDPRPMAVFPQGMVSTSMQGGCTCENGCLLRIGTGNVELAALFAPKPQGMTAADDWTKEMMNQGYPELQQLYGMLGARENVLCQPLLHFPHNYNYVTRGIMYRWFNKHLRLGLPEPIVEEHWEPLTPSEWTVWDAEHPQPAGGPEYERALNEYLAEQSVRQLAGLQIKDAESLRKFREVVGGAWGTILDRGLAKPDDVERHKLHKADRAGYLEFADVVRFGVHGEELPVVFLFPTAKEWNKQVVIWLTGDGKEGLFDVNGGPRPEIRRLLESGASIVTADLLYQGEFLPDGRPIHQTRTVNTDRAFAGFTLGYNHSLFVQRVHDVLTLVSYVKHDTHAAEQVHLVGMGAAGPIVAAARLPLGSAVARVCVDNADFRFADLTSCRDVNFVPGAVKYGDLPALLALSAPHPIWLATSAPAPDVVSAAYSAAGAGDRVSVFHGQPAETVVGAVDWLLLQD